MNGCGYQKLNEAMFTFLPKIPDASSHFDYWSISLIHPLENLFTKVLSLWIAPRFGYIVSANQSSFIAGCGMHENFMLVQQTVRQLHNLKNACVLPNLKIMLAFDWVSWPYIFEILQHLGFGKKWIPWVSTLLSSSLMTVHINDIPAPLIEHACGQWQGAPLSTMLFILIIDALNSGVRHAILHGVL